MTFRLWRCFYQSIGISMEKCWSIKSLWKIRSPKKFWIRSRKKGQIQSWNMLSYKNNRICFGFVLDMVPFRFWVSRHALDATIYPKWQNSKAIMYPESWAHIVSTYCALPISKVPNDNDLIIQSNFWPQMKIWCDFE